jgi:hypothetical protein
MKMGSPAPFASGAELTSKLAAVSWRRGFLPKLLFKALTPLYIMATRIF